MVCGIASLGIDHEAFLLAPEDGVPGEPLARIAFEKAGIAKPRVPLVTQAYPLGAAKAVIDVAMVAGARPAMRGLDWFAEIGDAIAYRDARGAVDLPLPALAGLHQTDNAALAVAMLRHQDALPVSPDAMAAGTAPPAGAGRLQRLGPGRLTALVPGARCGWTAGTIRMRENAGGAFRSIESAAPLIGMLVNKNARAIVGPLAANLASVTVVPIPGHESHPAEAFGDAKSAPDVAQRCAASPPPAKC